MRSRKWCEVRRREQVWGRGLKRIVYFDYIGDYSANLCDS